MHFLIIWLYQINYFSNVKLLLGLHYQLFKLLLKGRRIFYTKKELLNLKLTVTLAKLGMIGASLGSNVASCQVIRKSIYS